MELELVTTEALLNELENRFDHVVLMAVREIAMGVEEPVAQTYTRRWKGTRLYVAGMCEYMKMLVIEDLRGSERPLEE